MIKVHSMFYTIQGEGTHAGTPALFVRLAGCNVWDGDPAKRAERARFGACAAICDTEFRETTMHATGGVYTGTVDEMHAALKPRLALAWEEYGAKFAADSLTSLHGYGKFDLIEIDGGGRKRPFSFADRIPLVVFTGGEPSLQLREGSEEATAFLAALRREVRSAMYSMETNGACEPPPQISWLTLSPKHPFDPPILRKQVFVDEVKILFPLYEQRIVDFWIPWARTNRNIPPYLGYKEWPTSIFIQPVDSPGKEARNMERAVAFAQRYADCVRVSVQTHKILGVA